MGKILTSNCGFRCFCGKATEAGSSLVALDNTLATTIDNTYPGMAVIQSAGTPLFARVFFSKFEDIEEYYKLRGLSPMGYNSDEIINTEELLDELEGTEEISFADDKTTFEFNGESAEIDKREDQKWEEI